MDKILENFITNWGPLGLISWILWDLLKTSIRRHEDILRQITHQNKLLQEYIARLDRRQDTLSIQVTNIEGYLESNSHFRASKAVKEVMDKKE